MFLKITTQLKFLNTTMMIPVGYVGGDMCVNSPHEIPPVNQSFLKASALYYNAM